MFNGHRLESENATLDSIYKEAIGMSYSEWKEKSIRSSFEYKKNQLEYQESIPKLIKEYIERGHKILDEKYWEDWDNLVPIRLEDLYHGKELNDSLEIIEKLNNGATFEEIRKIIEDQNHSGMSLSLVRTIVNKFCIKGPALFNQFHL